MRASLVKYTEVLDFRVKEERATSYNDANNTEIRWKLPKLTDEQEAAILDGINAQFGPQDSSLVKKKVLEWRIHKRKCTQWYFKLFWSEPKIETKNRLVFLAFHDGNGGYFRSCRGTAEIIEKGADVEFLLQIGNSEVLFNDLRHETRAKCKLGSERFYHLNKLVPVEICNQLTNVPRDQVSVTVFGTFPEGNQGMDLRSNFDWPTSPNPNWTSSERYDVTIRTGDEEDIRCHSNFFTRNSRVLSELLVSPTLKPFEVDLLDLSKIQVEAFLSYQYNGTTDKILETPMTSLGVLKAAERYETRQMWTDTMKGLLDKDSDWFEEVALKLSDFLGNCSKREEDATKNLIHKISQKLGHLNQRVKIENVETEEASLSPSSSEEEVPWSPSSPSEEEGDNEAESACHNLGRNKIRSGELVQLKLKLDPVSLLKFVQCYKNEEMWSDIILTLLEKDSDWFEWDLALELKTFLKSCFKRDEEATQKLTKTLSQILEQPRPIVETTQIREEEDQNGEIAENTRNSQPGRAKRMKVTEEDQLMGNNSSPVGTLSGPVAVTRKLRRSARLQAEAEKEKKGDLQTDEEPRKKAGREDVTWTNALRVGAELERNTSKSGGAGRGPRDIWKDPVLPKISIIPDPMVKVEKVEPPEVESEDSPGMDAEGIQLVVQDLDCVTVTVKEEETFPMDASENYSESAEYGVIESSWSLRQQPTDENI